jgi:HEAT repeat protein
MLRGGDRRSTGRVDEVIRRVRDPEGFRELVMGLLSPNELVRMRCADAIEKVSRIHADWLEPHTAFFVEQAARQTQQEVRWHMAQIIPRLALARSQRARAIRILRGYLDDSSGIVRVSALQALAELSVHDTRLGRQIVSLINQVMTNGTPAVRARGKRLVRELQSRKER